MEHGDSFSHNGQNTKPSSGNSSRSNPMWDKYASLPHAKVMKIMRQVLPKDAGISDDAVDTVQKCASEFIAFITDAAIEHSKLDKRMTVSAEDLLFVMENMGFDDYVPPLTLFLERYRKQSVQHGVPNVGTPPPPSPPPTLPQSEITNKTSLDMFYEDGVGDV
ncbi:PREDICTED: nuclear transcription factor Y subunit B-1-like [Lupinus angustifolius]|nr:PREDICTED: nuclear transcription factor Y subunit B-1-like [Lupinus angustifolius]